MEETLAELKPVLNPDAVNGGASNGDAVESECLNAALDLRKTLQEEADVLKRFAGPELLLLIPRKEFLISELGSRLNDLRSSRDDRPQVSDSLKALLGEIDALNRSNSLFIQRSLSYWHDLMSIFSPPAYGPARDGARPNIPAPRGLSFSREV